MDDISLPPSVGSLPPPVDSPSPNQEGNDCSCSMDETPGPTSHNVSVELPESIDSDGDMHSETRPNVLDEEVPTDAESIDLMGDFESALETHPLKTPSPAEAMQLTGHHHFAEYYSPPRTVPLVQRAGLTALLSLDILTGWNFQDRTLQRLSLQLLTTLSVLFLVVCPPCRAFSELQRLWNFKRMSLQKQRDIMNEGMIYLTHAMEAARAQWRAGRFFMFEHPARASSWSTDVVKAMAAEPGVKVITIDLCCFGLCSKVTRTPMRKRTKIMTNSAILAQKLQGRLCPGTHEHQTIQGSEGGVRRSTWAQIYPAGFVEVIASSAKQHASAE